MNSVRALSLRKALILCLVAAAAAAFLFLDTAWAQEEPEDSYVDLVMLYEYQNDEDVEYSVQNNGTATATGVYVSFLLEDLQAGASFTFIESTDPPIITDKETVDTTNQRFTWVIGNMPPGSAFRKLVFRTSLHSGHSSAGRIGSIRAEAFSASPEPDVLSDNNVKKFYSYADTTTGASLHMRRNWLALLLSVDDLRPAAGGDVNFALTAHNAQGGAGTDNINLIADAKVKVELSDGLEFKSGWTPPSTFVKSGSQSATWSPPDTDTKISTTAVPDSQEIEIQTQLTSGTPLTGPTGIPLKDRCITARVTDSIPPPSADYLLGSLKQCLGDDPPLLFEQGNLQAFTPYPCVDASGTAITSYPCDASDSTSEVAVIAVADSDAMNPDPRLQGVGRSSDGKVTLIPDQGNITVQLKDPFARVLSGSAVTWQTGRKQGVGSKTVPGVIVTYTVKEFLDTTSGKECPKPAHPGTETCRWSNLAREVKVKGLTQGSAPPGGVKVKINNSSETQHYDANSGNSYTHTRATWDLGRFASSNITSYFLEFSTLGTHVIDFKAGATRRSDSAVQDDTGTYTFHVGPIAELEVRDVGQNPVVPAGQRAYTIMAVNNGPDTAPAAKVTLSDMDAASCTAGTATKGATAFAGSECTWTIGELIAKDVSKITKGRDGEVLTIITSDAVDTEITAAITNTEDYEVCIDSSGDDVALTTPSNTACTTEDATNNWHTAKYYDYISDNDSATIKAKDGTGADLPTVQPPQAETAAIIVSWTRSPRSTGGR